MAQVTAHQDGCRFKLPHGVKGMSRIHEDLSSSCHQPGKTANGCDRVALERPMPAGRRLHVGIVGGGVAGLRCADVLLEHGIQVTIVEGRDRLGGRLGQGTMMGKHLVDLGPNWIHGTENNPMMDLAIETGTVTHSWGENQIMFDPDGRVLPRERTAEAQGFVWDTIEKAFDESNDRYDRGSRDSGIAAGASLKDFFARRIEERYGGGGGGGDEGMKRIVRDTSAMWGAFVGQPIERQSLRFFWLEECLEGSNLFCADSYRKILARISAPAVRSAAIEFGCKVTRIRSRSGGLDQGRSRPSVAFECGRREGEGDADADADAVTHVREQAFDELVVTTPLGWLQRNPAAFEPRLPKRLSAAISSLGYGNLDKVYISFRHAFWNEPLPNNGAAVPPTEHQQQAGPNVAAAAAAAAAAAPAPAHQPPKATTTSQQIVADDPNFPGFATFLAPSYAADTNPHRSNQELLNFAALPARAAQPTLLFYVYGDFADRVADAVAACPARPAAGPADARYIAALWPLFRPYVALLPNFDAAEGGPSSASWPVDMLATAWASDGLAGNGSYTNFPVGLERGDEDVEAIREGLPERGVWFAGEHTAPFVALGTVTGAYWSGEAVARRILAAYGVGGGVRGGGEGAGRRL